MQSGVVRDCIPPNPALPWFYGPEMRHLSTIMGMARATMEHKLNALVRLDLDPAAAVIDVTGCLTLGGSQALLQVIRRLAGLPGAGFRSLTISLLSAGHVDGEGLAYLQGLRSTAPESLTGTPMKLRIQAPEILPECPSLDYRPAGAGFSAFRGTGS